MTYDLGELTTSVVLQEFGVDVKPVFSRPAPEHGDFSTNVAMQLAGQLKKSPLEIAEILKQALEDKAEIQVSIAGPGFINIRLSDKEIFKLAQNAVKLEQSLEDKVVVAEYSDPNPFKVLHAGHLYTSLVGDAIGNMMQSAGGKVHRVNFGGDVGLHVGKTMWAIITELGGEFPEKLKDIPDDKKLDWISQRYVQGNKAYEDDSSAKKEIIDLNKRIYGLHTNNDQSSSLAKIYWLCRQLSYEGFDGLYKRLNMKPFDKYYPESSVSELGLKTVKKHVGKVYEESEGAIIFRGEPYGLFTQVFINSEGLPTYAGKDVGLIQHKYIDYKYDLSYIITDSSQKDHLAVVMKSVEQYEPALVKKTVHHTHGRLKLQGGTKMSSRKGNILKASDILDVAFKAASVINNNQDPEIVLGAIRYSFLRVKIGADIVYDPKESVSLEGNSGPYLQYALVRARSILRKADNIKSTQKIENLDQLERDLARVIGIYPEVFEQALADYSPHHICSYLYSLAVTFNRFYEKSRVVDHERSSVRLALVELYEQTLSHGLSVLGMPKPERM